ncbi:serine/threonine-protein kinase [Actinophytocola sp.]|uniref:serine/threonine-protein kinase n=1 Tax=Actinophytocola sp. TaxID=1872138 RepID=UPI002ED0E204
MNVLVGRGPVAEVYAVEKAALKLFPGKFDRRTLATIERERTRLASAPVLRFDGVEVVKGRHALRMELCADSLAARVARDGPLASEEVAALCEVLSRALAAAHGRGVLHGGVSPANVLYRTTGEPVLADFGVAQRQAFRRDPLDGVEWVSPETLRTGEVTAKTDLYGLGAVLHFALTGESPHPSRIGETTGERILRVLGEPVPAISRPDVPIGLSTTIGRLLAPDPAKRTAPWTEDVPETRPPSGPRVWWWAAVVVLAVVSAVVFWPRQGTSPPPAPVSSAPVIELDEPVDLTDQVSLRWTTTDDSLYFAVIFWVEGAERKSELAEFNRAMTVPVEPDRAYCFFVRGTNGDKSYESQSRAVRGAVCNR